MKCLVAIMAFARQLGLLLLSIAALIVEGAEQRKKSVVQKVVVMLTENKVKIVKDLEKEETEMAAYSQYCDDEVAAKNHAISTSTRKIHDQDGAIEDAEAQVKAASDEISQLGVDMANKDRELAQIVGVRNREHEDFQGTEREMVEAVGKLEQSVLLVKRAGVGGFLQNHGKNHGKHDKKKGKAKPDIREVVRQLSVGLSKVVDAAWVDSGTARVLKGFLQEHDGSSDGDAEGDDFSLTPHKEDKSAGGLLDTLEDMKEKAEEALSSARTTEMRQKHSFDMMSQSLNDAMAMAKKKLSTLQTSRASLTESLGRAKGQRAETARTKKADEEYLGTLKLDCSSASQGWAERKRSANAEMASIAKAVDILTNRVNVLQHDDDYEGDDSGDDGRDSLTRRKLVSQLKALGHRYNNYGMLEIACTAADGPFDKIRGLISDMIEKLVREANDDASQKEFCDGALKSSKQDQEEKSIKSDKLQARIGKATATRDALQESIKELTREIAELDRSFAAATKMRQEEHNTFRSSYADYKEAEKAVEAAMAELKGYYQSLSLAQSSDTTVRKAGSRRQPEFGGSKKDASNGIIAILETCLRDYSQMSVEILSAEKDGEDSFKVMTEETKVAKAAKEAEVRAAQSEVRSLAVALDASNEDFKMVGQELDAIDAYLQKLKPQCEQQALSQQEAVKKRQDEIKGLREALAIIGGNDAPGLL